MPLTHVTEFPATAPEQIDHFARLLNKSEDFRKVFAEVYRGQSKKPKTAAEIGQRVGLSAKRVLEIATPLSAAGLFEKTKSGPLIGYRKFHHINTVKKRILSLAKNPRKLADHVTVRSRRTETASKVVVKLPLMRSSVRARRITVDEIDQFEKVRSKPAKDLPANMDPRELSESDFKRGLLGLLAGTDATKDWAGEANDIFTTHLSIKGKRYSSAFALKGPGAVKGTVTPGNMGANGDQIQRLVASGVQVCVVQAERPIAQTVYEQLEQLAQAKSALTGQEIFHCVINKADSYRLRMAYPEAFHA
jgi:hypothetical protein